MGGSRVLQGGAEVAKVCIVGNDGRRSDGPDRATSLLVEIRPLTGSGGHGRGLRRRAACGFGEIGCMGIAQPIQGALCHQPVQSMFAQRLE